ncbi:MAG: hypothetical protein V3U84_02720 [Thiotrichaceae bacterium]
MELSRTQLKNLHSCMSELLDNAEQQESITSGNIKATNRVILVFTMLGAALTISIFFLFFGLTSAIKHSVESMAVIESQVTELSATMNNITSSVESMGRDVESLYDMNESVGHMALKTGIINTYIAKLNDQTKWLSSDVSYVRHHVDNVNWRFSSINRAIGGVSYSLHETAKPIRQFIPIP